MRLAYGTSESDIPMNQLTKFLHIICGKEDMS